jgi:hypothetical protein
MAAESAMRLSASHPVGRANDLVVSANVFRQMSIDQCLLAKTPSKSKRPKDSKTA